MAFDRRHSGQAEQSPAEKLQQMPAVVVLERVPVPAVAIDEHGTILLANAAFAVMLGYPRQALEQLTFQQIFRRPVDEPPAATAARSYARELVQLKHRDGFIVLARMSTSAVKRYNDGVALVIFEDLTEQLWTDGLRGKCQRCPVT